YFFLLCCSSFSSRSRKRSGTPWDTTSSYMARSCCPILPLMSRPSVASDFPPRSGDRAAGRGSSDFRFFISILAPRARMREGVAGPHASAQRRAGRMVPVPGTFFRLPCFALYFRSNRVGEAEKVSISQAVAQHLPYLRRYARALTGSQNSGDAYV